MISWMTIVILSAPRRSTSGRAPWFSAIIRFWINVESLNRPPTLLTISSSFNSSSIEGSSSTAIRAQGRDEILDATVKVVVDQKNVVPVGFRQLLTRLAQPPEDRRLVLGAAAPQPLFEHLEPGGFDEDKECGRGGFPDLERPTDLDLQEDRSPGGQRVEDGF